MDIIGLDRWRWNFAQAYPVKWVGPELKADSSTVAFETIELAHHGIKKG
jgi:phage tail-like protein